MILGTDNSQEWSISWSKENISGQFHQTETLISDNGFMLLLLQCTDKYFLFGVLFFHGSTKNPVVQKTLKQMI